MLLEINHYEERFSFHHPVRIESPLIGTKVRFNGDIKNKFLSNGQKELLVSSIWQIEKVEISISQNKALLIIGLSFSHKREPIYEDVIQNIEKEIELWQ